MSWEEKLQNHIDLSDANAEDYDANYGSIITKSYMEFEKARIEAACELVANRNNKQAIDVGCGTGRCTIELSAYFEKVIGYDFSSKMIDVAHRNCNKQDIENVVLELRNVNEGLGPFDNNIAFLNFAFGMGSFFENINYLKTEIKRILEPKGIVYITFYNKNSFVYNMCHQYDMGITAIPNSDGNGLLVDGIDIPCNFFTVEEVRKCFSDEFDEVSIVTYPTILPLVKAPLLKTERILEYCKKIDESVAVEEEGYYISAIFKLK